MTFTSVIILHAVYNMFYCYCVVCIYFNSANSRNSYPAVLVLSLFIAVVNKLVIYLNIFLTLKVSAVCQPHGNQLRALIKCSE